MNNLAYTSQQANVVAPRVEEIVRTDLAAPQPLGFQIKPGDAAPASVGSFFGDVVKGLVGGKSACLFSVAFEVASPRPMSLEVRMDRQGVGCHAGVLAFSAPLRRAVGAPIALAAPKLLGKSKFEGPDAAACGKLNGSSDLIKRANAFARTEGSSGGISLEIPRCFQIVPSASGARLVALTLPRMIKMGMGATTDAGEFLKLAELVEQSL